MRRRNLLLSVFALPMLPLRAADKDEMRIVYVRKDGDRHLLHVMNADGTNDRALPGQTANAQFMPTCSGDGKRIAYVRGSGLEEMDLQLVVCNADGTDHCALTLPDKAGFCPAWSPDGKRLAYAAGSKDGIAIYVADADGRNSRAVTPADGLAMWPFWSADGASVGYAAAPKPGHKSEIYLAPLAGGEARRITNEGKLVFSSAGAASPDGKQIAYTVLTDEPRAATIKMMDLAGGMGRTLLEVLMGEDTDLASFPMPTWAPDGKSFLITMSTEKGKALYRYSADGKMRQTLTPEDAVCASGAWLPAAR